MGLNSLLKNLNCLADLIRRAKGVGQIVLIIRLAGRKEDGLAMCGDGLGQVTQLPPGYPKIVPSGRVVRSQAHNLLVAAASFDQLPEFLKGQAEVKMGVGIIRLDPHGLIEAAGGLNLLSARDAVEAFEKRGPGFGFYGRGRMRRRLHTIRLAAPRKVIRRPEKAQLEMNIIRNREAHFSFRKFFKIVRPFSVKMLSGWNCTPQIGRVLCFTPMISPSSVSAVISRTSGTVSRLMTREW